jgi:hypothetical protein
MERLDELEEPWQREAAALIRRLRVWRQQHPRATLTEMETALDERLSGLRVRLLEDLALASAAAEVGGRSAKRAPCPTCGQPLERRGRHTREVVTHGGRVLRLAREYAVCPSCGDGLFPPG